MTVRKIFIRFCNNIRHFSNEFNKCGGWISFSGGWNFLKSVRVDSTPCLRTEAWTQAFSLITGQKPKFELLQLNKPNFDLAFSFPDGIENGLLKSYNYFSCNN